jgi:hypothetical protein
MFNIFSKKKSKTTTKQKVVKGFIVPKHMIKEFKTKKFDPKKFEPEVHSFTIHYRDTKTGEIHEIDLYDNEAFDKMKSNKHAQLIFK